MVSGYGCVGLSVVSSFAILRILMTGISDGEHVVLFSVSDSEQGCHGCIDGIFSFVLSLDSR